MATILIVDDHVLNRQFLLALLGFEHHHQLLQAVDGAKDLLQARAGRPDLIITDIMMPRMDGYEFVTRLRAEPALCAIPVMYSTSTCSMHEAHAMDRACDVRWVLQKPAAPQAILAAVHAALGLPDVSAAGAAPPAGAGSRLFRQRGPAPHAPGGRSRLRFRLHPATGPPGHRLAARRAARTTSWVTTCSPCASTWP